jgi:hypothetical protein
MLAQRKITFVKIIKISLFTSKFDTLATHNSPHLIKGEQSGMKNFVFKSYFVNYEDSGDPFQITQITNKKSLFLLVAITFPTRKSMLISVVWLYEVLRNDRNCLLGYGCNSNSGVETKCNHLCSILIELLIQVLSARSALNNTRCGLPKIYTVYLHIYCLKFFHIARSASEISFLRRLSGFIAM